MITKSGKQSTGAKRGRVKLGKLKLKKETVKTLSGSEVKKIRGGAVPVYEPKKTKDCTE